MNYFSKHSESLQKLIFEKNKQSIGLDLSVVFYDVSTFYFDSEQVVAGSLRQKGFSKDGKIGQTQVVFGLLIDALGNPVGYELYAGNQSEKTTVVGAVERLKRKYGIGKLTFVADTD